MSEPLIITPTIYHAAQPEEWSSFEELCANKQLRVVDTLSAQVDELIQARRAGAPLDSKHQQMRAALLGESGLNRWGRAVYYPWAGVAVRLLPAALLRELRLDRNRNKITSEEQDKLRSARVGVVGLSVGNAVAVTLAQEGIVGSLKLADFDTLSISNLNRIRASLLDLGLSKTVIAARQIAELDPDLKIELFSEGLSTHNLDAFLDGLDVVVDECDSLPLKIALRVAARARRIPVVMDTSDRGKLDIERFDLEPNLPLLHGRVSDDISATLSAGERLDLVAAIVGDDVSTRAGASMLEIGASLSTWPQLASDVAHGGAAVCTAVRRILLGQPAPSGRRIISLDEAIANQGKSVASFASVAPQTVHSDPFADRRVKSSIRNPSGSSDGSPGLRLRRLRPRMTEGRVNARSGMTEGSLHHALIEAARSAPSGGNCQPWRFWPQTDSIGIEHVREISASILDAHGHAGLLAVGASIEAMSLRASELGCSLEVTTTGATSGLVATARPIPGASPDPLAPFVARRFTDRRNKARIPFTEEARASITAAISPHIKASFTSDASTMEKLAEHIGAVDRVRFLHQQLHQELWKEVRWTPEEAASQPDGLTTQEMALRPGERAILGLLRRPDVASCLREQHGGARLGDLAKEWIQSASALGLLWLPSTPTPAALLQAGRSMMRGWLSAIAAGYSLHPIGVAVYMFEHLRSETSASYLPSERQTLSDAEQALGQLLPCPKDATRLLLFRLLQGGERYATTHRLPLTALIGAP